jgi:16S rRNA (guanine966-N2)-methyltransferase
MRVIAGTRKSLTLKSVPGMGTRPTTDRIKETLFNIISPYLYESRFLDVFAGSGGIGIEALSRGASFCCFIEKEPKAVSVIRENIKKTGFEKESEIIKNNAANIDIFLNDREPFDIVFMDPPYGCGLEKTVIEKLVKTNSVKADTMYIVEASLDTDFSWADGAGLVCTREKIYKTNKHVFLRRPE